MSHRDGNTETPNWFSDISTRFSSHCTLEFDLPGHSGTQNTKYTTSQPMSCRNVTPTHTVK